MRTEFSRTGILQNGVSKATAPRSANEIGWNLKRNTSYLKKYGDGFQIWSPIQTGAILFNEYDEAESVIAELGIRAKVVLSVLHTELELEAEIPSQTGATLSSSNNEIPLNVERIAASMNEVPNTVPCDSIMARKYNPDIPASMRDFMIFQECETDSDPGALPEEF